MLTSPRFLYAGFDLKQDGQAPCFVDHLLKAAALPTKGGFTQPSQLPPKPPRCSSGASRLGTNILKILSVFLFFFFKCNDSLCDATACFTLLKTYDLLS